MSDSESSKEEEIGERQQEEMKRIRNHVGQESSEQTPEPLSDQSQQLSESASSSRETESSGSSDPGSISTATSSSSASDSKSDSGSSSRSQPKSIRKLWSNHSYYLDDDLSDDISDEFKRLDFELATEHDVDIKKTRHYYPLIASLGLEKLQELENEDVINRIQEIEPDDNYFNS